MTTAHQLAALAEVTIGTSWECVAEVYHNEDGHHCIHSVPVIEELEPGGTASVCGAIVLVPGGPEEARARLQGA